MSDIDDLKNDPNQAAPELIYPADTNSDGEATIGFPANPSARGDGSATTGILHGVDGDDLSTEALETLGQYLGEWTKSNITQISSNPGTATPIVDPNQRSGQTYHAVEDSRFFSAEAYNWAADAKLTPATQYSDGDHTANTMLRDVAANAPGWGAPLDARDDSNSGPGIPEQTVSAVLSQNRFMQGKPSNMGDGVSTQKYMLTQKHSLATGDSTIGRYNAAADGVALGELSNMAERLLKAAAGEVDRENSFDSILPSEAQWGPGVPGFNGKVDVNSMRAGAQLSTARSDPFFIATDIGTPFPTGGTTSYGQLNHPDETFGGLPLGMIAVAIVSALALAVISLVTSLLLDVFGMMGGFPPKNHGATDIQQPHALPLGARHGSKSDKWAPGIGAELFRWMGIAQLKNDYGGGFAGWFKFTRACLMGLVVFWIPQIFFSSGYYAVVHRNALRDIEQVEKAVGNMASGEIDPIAGTFLLIEAFTTSATFRFTNVLISLGDLVLQKGGYNANAMAYGSAGWAGEWGLAPAANESTTTIATLHAKGRESADSSWQALRLSNLPLKLLKENDVNFDRRIPEEWDVEKSFTEQTLESGDLSIGGPGLGGSSYTHLDGARFSTAEREAMEQRLDSYYMPFYFHDLRTNEIVPFHCFVENISDSFSPEYSQITGFGRMDPVQIYKSTTRKIGFSFWIVAQDEADASVMWASINRLVAMVYPQWTTGDVRSDENGNKFVMPFSQVVGAGPLIRIRLGNLFHSNVAPRSVKRLFGLGDPEKFNMTPTADTTNIATLREDPDAIDQIFQQNVAGRKWEPGDKGREWTNFSLNYFTNLPFKNINDSPFPLSWNTKGYAPGFTIQCKRTALLPMKFDPTSPSGWSNVGEEGKKAWSQVKKNAIFPGGVHAKIINYYAELPWETGNRLGYIVSWEHFYPGPGATAEADVANISGEACDGFFVWFGFAHPPKDNSYNIDWAIGQLMGAAAESKYDVPDEFFEPENNVIVRAFEDSGGKGLAGVITNLDIDWNVAPWDVEGTKAPQYCKVSLGFSPIHDIAPGLSSDGAMRASVYPAEMDKLFGAPGTVSEIKSKNIIEAWRAAKKDQALDQIEEASDPGGLE